jgi:hypothetical protein
VLPWLENRKKELVNRPLIREQAFGESPDPDKLERLGAKTGRSPTARRTGQVDRSKYARNAPEQT